MSDAQGPPPGSPHAREGRPDPDAPGADGASDDHDATAGEPVGSVGEEAAKLLGALSDWARDQGDVAGEAAGSAAGSAAGMADSFAAAAREVNEHLSTGGPDCRYCPVCQVIHVVRETSPEVRAHLSVAASSLMHAAAGLLATHTPSSSASAGVEKIDLDDSTDWEEEP